MKGIYTYFLLSIYFLVSLTFAYVVYCDSDIDCPYWADCISNSCVPHKGYCYYSSDCNYWEHCDTSKNKCILEKGYCNSDVDCGFWQRCTSYHFCETLEGYCDIDYDCKYYEKCNNATHRCELMAGYCKNDTDCKPWQYCLYNQCILKPDMCEKDTDCTFSWERCISHKCVDIIREGVPKSSNKVVLIIFDNSGSMYFMNKIELAKNASLSLIDSLDDAEIALLRFESGCNTAIAVNWTTDKDEIKDKILRFKADGGTPLAQSLIKAYSMLEEKAHDGPAYVILFTDGGEACGGNPCAVVKNYGQGRNIPIYTIGYIVNPGGKNQLECIANVSGGKYLEAPTPESINEIFSEVASLIKEENCTSDDDCMENKICDNGTCVVSKIHFVFVPVNWKSGREKFDSEVKDQLDFFINSVPSLANCSNKIKVSKTVNCKFAVNPDGNLSDLDKIYDCAKKSYKNFDFVVGIGDKGIFNGVMKGYTGGGKTVIFIERGNEIVLAHELGHKFGLLDEYCYCPGTGICGEEPNPLKKEYGCDPYNDCCWSDFEIFGFEPFGNRCYLGNYEKYGCKTCCSGNKNKFGGRSIMSWANAEGPRYHDTPSLEHLAQNPKLRCD